MDHRTDHFFSSVEGGLLRFGAEFAQGPVKDINVRDHWPITSDLLTSWAYSAAHVLSEKRGNICRPRMAMAYSIHTSEPRTSNRCVRFPIASHQDSSSRGVFIYEQKRRSQMSKKGDLRVALSWGQDRDKIGTHWGHPCPYLSPMSPLGWGRATAAQVAVIP